MVIGLVWILSVRVYCYWLLEAESWEGVDLSTECDN